MAQHSKGGRPKGSENRHGLVRPGPTRLAFPIPMLYHYDEDRGYEPMAGQGRKKMERPGA